jgi:hypothetical protein
MPHSAVSDVTSALNSTNGMVYGLYHYNDSDIDLISLSVV